MKRKRRRCTCARSCLNDAVAHVVSVSGLEWDSCEWHLTDWIQNGIGGWYERFSDAKQPVRTV